MKKQYDLEEELVGNFDITDIDMEYYYDKDIRLNIKINKDVYYCGCPPADINDVIKKLTDLKKKGAERVYISEHVDHHGYYFFGIKTVPYKPQKTITWKCIKSFPGADKDDVFYFDEITNKFYKNGNDETNFKDFDKYPELFQYEEIMY